MAVTATSPHAAADWQPPTPPPIRDDPPHDRFCDLVLNGGVASGVVYPWALVELARHFRFRRIGGNSVGAMAGALAAAGEYGRCCGNPLAFEPLRRAPIELAKTDALGRTQMLRLFQPADGVRRLFDVFVAAVRRGNSTGVQGGLWLLLLWRDVSRVFGLWGWWLAGVLLLPLAAALQSQGVAAAVLLAVWVLALGLALAEARLDMRQRRAHVRGAAMDDAGAPARPDPAERWQAWGLVALLGSLLLSLVLGWLATGRAEILLAGFGWAFAVAALAGVRAWAQLRSLRENRWGLCSGRAQSAPGGAAPAESAIVEWLHEGVQRAAGRERHDAPLTFQDLWGVRRPGEPAQADAPREPGIALHMFSTNLTLGRPVAWPLDDRNTRLFFRREEWELFFPPTLLDAVWGAARPYAPADDSDPPADDRTAGFREIPGGGMPIAVAARLSLSFPLLFSCVPVYAIDYEMARGERLLRQCLLTDGGLCTNFPIHLFDAAHPRWPTFGLMLSRRIAAHRNESVWRPDHHRSGRADNWTRSVPGARDGPEPAPLRGLTGLLLGMVSAAMGWSDHLTSRMATVRNRVLRMHLAPGEGHLNIAMPRQTMLRMAHEYGTRGGQALVQSFAAEPNDCGTAWREHLYVRAVSFVREMRRHLQGYGRSVACAGFSEPLASVLHKASLGSALQTPPGRAPDPAAAQLTEEQRDNLLAAVRAIRTLEAALDRTDDAFGPYEAEPRMKLQMRPML